MPYTRHIPLATSTPRAVAVSNVQQRATLRIVYPPPPTRSRGTLYPFTMSRQRAWPVAPQGQQPPYQTVTLGHFLWLLSYILHVYSLLQLLSYILHVYSLLQLLSYILHVYSLLQLLSYILHVYSLLQLLSYILHVYSLLQLLSYILHVYSLLQLLSYILHVYSLQLLSYILHVYSLLQLLSYILHVYSLLQLLSYILHVYSLLQLLSYILHVYSLLQLDSIFIKLASSWAVTFQTIWPFSFQVNNSVLPVCASYELNTGKSAVCRRGKHPDQTHHPLTIIQNYSTLYTD